MKKTLIFLCTLFIALCSFSQKKGADTLNYMDANGKKQGHWIQKYQNGNVQFEGYFKNNVPVGQFKKYHENGQLKYDMFYDTKDANRVTVTMYDIAGELSAKGEYYAKKKNGTWQYYGSNNQVIMEENYNHGMLDGKSTVFWQSNPTQPMEIKYWKDSLKHGDWMWFYEDGKVRQKTHYIENKLNGEFLVFFSDGTQHIKGAYKNDLRDGLWEYFNEDGSSKIKIDYKDGKIVNEDEFEKAQTKLINEEYIEQEGKHIDPQDFLDNPEAYIFGTQNTEEQAPTPKAKKKKEKSKK
ncbi:MAG: toxin-antitoxin system YwqK family antitoxin [Bacteroidales bacterium]|nr:toxin-antitoxin system YwqK family antitoxin [Bacteroidales bacterium]